MSAVQRSGPVTHAEVLLHTPLRYGLSQDIEQLPVLGPCLLGAYVIITCAHKACRASFLQGGAFSTRQVVIQNRFITGSTHNVHISTKCNIKETQRVYRQNSSRSLGSRGEGTLPGLWHPEGWENSPSCSGCWIRGWAHLVKHFWAVLLTLVDS